MTIYLTIAAAIAYAVSLLVVADAVWRAPIINQ